MTAPVVLDWKLRADAIASGGETMAFSVTAGLLPTLAKAIGVDAIRSCSATVRLVPKGEAVNATGVVRATVVQTCTVSLEPFEATIDEPVDVRFVPEDEIAKYAPRVEADGEEGSAGMADLPEPIVGGILDLGALAQELLSLGVDPYPRKPGVVFEQPDEGNGKLSPFAALKRLRKPENDR